MTYSEPITASLHSLQSSAQIHKDTHDIQVSVTQQPPHTHTHLQHPFYSHAHFRHVMHYFVNKQLQRLKTLLEIICGRNKLDYTTIELR